MEAVKLEKIVGLFDSERGSGVLWTIEEFNEFSPLPSTQAQLPAQTPAQIQGVRTFRGTLFQRWFALPSGQTLELKF